MTTLHESPCGEAFSTPEDATSHQWHCDQCAGVLESIERMLDSLEATEAELMGHSQPMLPGLG